MPDLRPITDAERPHLAALGAELRSLRHAARPTDEERALRRARGKIERLPDLVRQSELAARAELGCTHISDLERGRYRTRRSTLRRIVAALVDEDLVEEIVDGLVEIAGPALAPESMYADRVARRRAVRTRRLREQTRSTLRQLERMARSRSGGLGDRVADLAARAREDLDRLNLEADQDEDVDEFTPARPVDERIAAIVELDRLRHMNLGRMTAAQLHAHFDHLEAVEQTVARLDSERRTEESRA